ncbi:zinc-ribbon domain-containing protein [Nocardia brasiliensis]|uniref:zinc-ribbon domain-containing protein n=1 Tax=Nocardia brasiliensis TaxID=37326 RepID=UPI0024560EAB|nr:zinc-ribbon domain-containing protein [Nocardia brasiliensis]
MRFKDAFPQLFEQLHPTRNAGLDLDALPRTYLERVWWQCPVGHEWLESPHRRAYLAQWKRGDITACLYCEGPGATVWSCHHHKFTPSETTFQVLPDPCEKCVATDFAGRLIDELPAAAADATEILDSSQVYGQFHSTAGNIVRWWTELAPLVDAYFVRMTALAIAHQRLTGRRVATTDELIGMCINRIASELTDDTQRDRLAALAPHVQTLRDDYLPGDWERDTAWGLRKHGFHSFDDQLSLDIAHRLEFLDQQRFLGARRAGTTTGTMDLPAVDLGSRFYPDTTGLTRTRPELSSTPLTPDSRPAKPRTTLALRARLDPAEVPVTGDPLGRTFLGYREGLGPAQLWDRGRGVWRFQAQHIVASTLLLVVHDRHVVLVGSITGLTIHPQGLAVLGEPLPDHPLIGHLDPLHTPNPIAHGAIYPIN